MDYNKNFDVSIFQDRLVTLLNKRQLSVSGFAEAIGEKDTRIRWILKHGKETISLSLLCKMADFFNVSIDSLIGIDHEHHVDLAVFEFLRRPENGHIREALRTMALRSKFRR